MDTVSNSCDREFDLILEAYDGTRISAHVDALSRSSLFFKSMFELCTFDEGLAKVITVHAVSGSRLTQFVEYCYTQKVTVANMENLIELVDFFQLNETVAVTCLELMSKNLCVENTMNFVIAAERHGREDFILLSMEFIDMFFEAMWTQDKFNELFVGTLQNILKRDTLEVSNEKIVFDAIIKWYKHDKRNRKQYLPDLVKLVRLSDLDRTFIASIFLNFVAANDCVQVFGATSEFLSRDDNSVHKNSDRRGADKIIAFDDHTIQIYVQKIKKWIPFTYVSDKSKAVAYDDRWMKEIDYLSPTFSNGYLSGVKKIHLTTRQTILENILDTNSRIRRISKIKVAAWTEGDNSILFVASPKHERFTGKSNDASSKILRCFQYDAKLNQWKNLLDEIYRIRETIHLAYAEPYLYALGASKSGYSSDDFWYTIEICRYNFRTASWESSRFNSDCKSHQFHNSINNYAGVGVVNGCIYLVGTPIKNTSSIWCFDPKTMRLKIVTTLKEPYKKIKVCGTKNYLYVVIDEECNSDVPSPSECRKHVFRYDPKESEGRNWKELDSLNSIVGDFQLVNVSNYGLELLK